MLGGTYGKVLHVDLTTGAFSIECPPDDFYRLLVGGRAVVAYFLLRDVTAEIDPFSPDNLLIFAPGIMQGNPDTGVPSQESLNKLELDGLLERIL